MNIEAIHNEFPSMRGRESLTARKYIAGGMMKDSKQAEVAPLIALNPLTSSMHAAMMIEAEIAENMKTLRLACGTS